MKNTFPNVRKIYLLLIAGIVWLIAGANIVRLGIIDFTESWGGNILFIFASAIVYALFTRLIFYPLVQKHTQRIMEYTRESLPFCYFFDIKSYLIMIFMITGGLLLRHSHIAPPILIGVLYTGIGASLVTAGILFLIKFAVINKKRT